MKNCLCKITAFLLALIILTSCTNNTNSSSVSKTESSTTADTTVTTSDTQATTTTTAETSATTTTATTAATTAAPTKPATTKPATTKAPPATTPAPAKVVMPTVKVPTSPGTETYSGGGFVMDVSNKSQGYFTVTYSGTETKPGVYVDKDGSTFLYNISSGKTEVLPFPLGNGTYKIIFGNLTSSSKLQTILTKEVSVSLSSSLSPFLYPNQKVNFSQGSACVKKSAEVCAGKTSDIDKIGAIFKFVTSTVTYDTAEAAAIGSGAITNYTPFPDEVLSTRKGICYDYASLFAAMTRAQGIPTKLVMGYVPINGQSLYHAWNEVYTNETGWIVVEFKAVPGFNTLDPTFYAGGSKASVASRFTDKNYYKVSKVF